MNSPWQEDDSITALNIAPLVDVILVILIIFMATAPLIHQRVIKVNVPKVAANETKATETLTITFTAKRELFVAGSAIKMEHLGEHLGGLFRADPSLHVSIQADRSVPYGEVTQILDIARSAGIKKVALDVLSKGKAR